MNNKELEEIEEIARRAGLREEQSGMMMADRLENDAAFLEGLYKQLNQERFLDMSTRIRNAAQIVRKCGA